MQLRRSLWLAATGRYFSMAANFATLAVVSRLLTPEEVGTFVLGSAVVLIAQSLREFGPVTYLIQRPQLTDEDVRGPFTFMALLSCLIAAALIAGAPWLASAYGKPGLATFMQVAALCTLLDLFSHPITALLSRELDFGKVAALAVLNAGLNLAATVVLALLGFGFMSFVWAWLASTIGNGLLALWMRPQLRIFLPSFTGWGELLAFGGRNGCNYILQQLPEQIPYLLLGRSTSAAALGTYNRALLVSRLPDRIILGGIIPVVLPAAAKQVREAQDLNGPYLRGMEMLTGIQWPILMLIALLVHPALRLLLGEQWLDAAMLVQILAAGALFSFAFPLNYHFLIALGAIGDVTRYALLVLPISTLIAASCALLGAEALALSMLLVIPMQAFASFHCAHRHMKWTWRELFRALGRSAIVTGCSTLGPLAVLAAHGFQPDVPNSMAAVAALLWLAGWYCGLRLTAHPILDEIQPALRTLDSRSGSPAMAKTTHGRALLR